MSTDISRRALLRRGAAGTAAGIALSLAPEMLLPAGAAAAAVVARTRNTGALNPRVDRYLGAQPADLAKPYAKYMLPSTLPMQEHVVPIYFGLPADGSRIPSFPALARDLNGPGYSQIETGYGALPGGDVVWCAVHTHMPRVTAAMWDWWFAWHPVESARYRLWHPDAHGFSATRFDRSATPGLTDRQKYIGNTSYIDEYIGGQLEQLAITFHEPASFGLHTSKTTTVICGRVGSVELPLDMGYLFHQVRPVPGGAEMRSRFYLNMTGIHPVDVAAATAAHDRGDLTALTQRLPFTMSYVRGLMEHCAREMNHLSRFLPELYADHH